MQANDEHRADILLTAAQMRAVEAAAIDSGTVTGLDLMERAGRGAVDAIEAEWPDLAATPGRAVVLCGPGNNGGDGFVVARLLAAKGWTVEVFLYGDADSLPPDARTNCARWRDIGEVQSLSGEGIGSGAHIPDLAVDAVFGTGLSRPLARDLCDAIKRHAATFTQGTKRVALDIPTGLSADTGQRLACEELSGGTARFSRGIPSGGVGRGSDVDLPCAEGRSLYRRWSGRLRQTSRRGYRTG